ncbi:uncharacterized protein PITG_17821 [Phytophthora infestans T30-4]|uniref:Uncharacterized protein n=1 Tax=Phytophthora infestans (strain T30-4) TaxID=403677 RepID=D0NW54_PHYIT|nr:uncharacterized protein PITG_17821 [Phytophthora infestans T30-4]EEY66939.1 conserved hypothetical protein [Phytophthora infestans T30-4]|eukprot:XP_002896657.1 conserved hypothetical protein [Phytophthora infestans T30-4]
MTASWSPWGTLTGWALAAGNDSEVTLLRGAVLGVVGWVVTTPLRRVAWAFADSMLEACSSAYFFVYTCGDRYLKTVRGEEALVLPPRAGVNSRDEALEGGAPVDKDFSVPSSSNVASSGTLTGGVPIRHPAGTVQPGSGESARRGHRVEVGENCHGIRLDEGLDLLAECIQKLNAFQVKRTTSNQLGHSPPTSAFPA